MFKNTNPLIRSLIFPSKQYNYENKNSTSFFGTVGKFNLQVTNYYSQQNNIHRHPNEKRSRFLYIFLICMKNIQDIRFSRRRHIDNVVKALQNSN